MPAVALEHLTKRFPNGVKAVQDVNLDVADGELLVLVGPSGSGKTTILRLIAGLEGPTSGTIRLRGEVANAWPPWKRDMAMVFQRPALYPHLNVYDNLLFGFRLRQPARWRRLLGLAKDGLPEGVVQKRVEEAARALGLDGLLNRRPAELSGGEQQRVALGRALVRQAGLVLLDEPLSNLEPGLRHEMRRELHLLQRRFRTTMIYVTHDQGEAMTLGDRVVVLERGTVRQVDRPQTLYDRPADRFVAGFIGWPPMNLVEGELAADGPQLHFTGGGWVLPVLPGLDFAGAKRVTLGIRPEDLGLAPAGTGPLPGWTLRVVLVERLGPTCLVTLERDALRLAVQTDARRNVAEGEAYDVTVNMQQLHWFEGTTGKAIAPTASG